MQSIIYTLFQLLDSNLKGRGIKLQILIRRRYNVASRFRTMINCYSTEEIVGR